jgi:hypothetical protein
MACMVVLTLLVFGMIILGRGKIGRKRGLILFLTYGFIMYLWANLK